MNSDPANHCLVVLGMHRSGTSCLTGMVEQCGVNLGEVFTQNPFNKKGNRESASIQALNNDVLAQNDAAWHQPVLATQWDERLRRERDRILNQLIPADGSWWGFKDPRVVFTLPFWLEEIPQPNFIATFRHPHRVAMSLNHRDGLALAAGYELWCLYNTQLLDWLRQYPAPLVDFDLPEQSYRDEVAESLGSLGLSWSADVDFFDASLRHQTSADIDEVDVPASVLAVYDELRAYRNA